MWIKILVAIGLLGIPMEFSNPQSPLLYNDGAGHGTGALIAAGRGKHGLEIQQMDDSVKLPEMTVSAVMSPNGKMIATLSSGGQISVSVPSQKCKQKISDIPVALETGSRSPAALCWDTRNRLLILLRGHNEEEPDVVIRYSFTDGRLNPPIAQPVNEENNPFSRYAALANSARTMLKANGVVLLGHHRANESNSQELFGYLNGSAGGTISSDGTYVLLCDLIEEGVLVYHNGKFKKRILLKHGKSVRQLRFASDLILIQTGEDKCEIWDAKTITFLGSVDCRMLVDRS